MRPGLVPSGHPEPGTVEDFGKRRRPAGLYLAFGRSRKGESSLNESGGAALIDEEARFPCRLELGFVVAEPLVGEIPIEVLKELMEPAFLERGSRTVTHPGERREPQVEGGSHSTDEETE